MSQDTFRVPLPQPQTVANEEEFVTNSGRKIKEANLSAADGTRDNRYLTPDVHRGNDMLGSGLSVLSPSPGENSDNKEKDLSESVQAELHLSLDRLSENYDPEELRRLQDKSKTHREKLASVKDGSSHPKRNDDTDTGKDNFGIGSLFDCMCKAPLTGDAEEIKRKQGSQVSKDSLDAEATSQSQYESEEMSGESEEYEEGEEEDVHTLVGDSLDVSSGRDSLTPLAKNQSKKEVKSTNGQKVDKYADLRYDPNWVKTKGKGRGPLVIDLTKGHDLGSLDADSLNEESADSHQEGGAIIVHKQALFSPALQGQQAEDFLHVSSRSLSPTRLSMDPVKLKQTNDLYEAEFHKLIKAEVENSEAESRRRAVMQQNLQPSSFRPLPIQDILAREVPNDGILIRRLEDNSQRGPGPETEPLIGGYQILPNRHRMLTPGMDLRQERQQDIMNTQQYFDTPNTNNSRRKFQPVENFVTEDKKDPLGALSPRVKNRPHVAPTPPKVPKPKNHKDYIELNKQRAGRKTNSAGYLELHTKRTRPNEQQPKSRSYSEMKGDIKKTNENSIASPTRRLDSNEAMPGSVEEMWLRQAQRLQMTKGENVNKGKIINPSRPPHMANGTAAQTFLASPRMNNWNRQQGEMQPQRSVRGHEHPKLTSQEQAETPGGLFTRLYERNNRDVFREAQRRHHPLPLPSEQNFFRPPVDPSNRSNFPSQDDLMNSLNEERMKKAFMATQRQYNQQDSPLMRAYHAQYGREQAEHKFAPQDPPLRPYFSEHNLSLPPQRTLSHQPEVWVNPDATPGYPTSLPPSHQSSNKNMSRRVTFLGDNEPLTLDGYDEERFTQNPVPASGNSGAGKYKVPLPPTPPSKSLHHGVTRFVHRDSLGKENISLEDYYNVREGTYPILPPILKSQQRTTSPLKSSPIANDGSPDQEKGGYLEQHEKHKKKLQYKIYTLNDYKNLKKDVKLGGLGPDMENARVKMEKVERARKYAEFIRSQHKSNALVKTKENGVEEDGENMFYNHHFSTRIDDKLRQELFEKRKRAIDYSKNVPRPKLKPRALSEGNSHNVSVSESPISPKHSDDSLNRSPRSDNRDNENSTDMNWSLLQMLKERHEREKAQVAMFSANN